MSVDFSNDVLDFLCRIAILMEKSDKLALIMVVDTMQDVLMAFKGFITNGTNYIEMKPFIRASRSLTGLVGDLLDFKS